MPVEAPDEILSSIVALGRAVFGAAACSLALLEPDEEHLVFHAAAGAGAHEVRGLRLPVDRGIAGWVVSSGQPIVVHEVRADPRFARDVAESTGYVPTSIMAMPLETSRDLLGVIEVLDRAPVEGRDDLGLLALLATQAARAVELLRGADQASARSPELPEVLAVLHRLGAEEQQAAATLLAGFVTYLERRGGPSGLV
ncbi:GAF domain-containing protein [Actinomycetospora sp. CA-084318]|uniref:GAF domain-containing protein n=1 Tax=Actinomycetospora sp. CA-084318 TaxID=3239892 RepID=UPI003D98B985